MLRRRSSLPHGAPDQGSHHVPRFPRSSRVLRLSDPADDRRSAAAQNSSFGEPLGRVYYSADPTSIQPSITAEPFVPFDVYMVLDLDYGDIGRPELNATTGVAAWETNLELAGLGSDFIILSARIRSIALNVGDRTNIIAGVSPPVLADQTPIDLVQYTLFAPVTDVPSDVVVTGGATTPTSFDPPSPGWVESLRTVNLRYCGVPMASAFGQARTVPTWSSCRPSHWGNPWPVTAPSS